MKSRVGLLALVLLVCLATGIAAAGTRNVVVVRGTPAIDGAVDDKAWGSAVWNELSQATATAENGAFKGFNSSFALLYDNTNIYFAFKAIDDKLVATQSGGNIWMDDCVELWLNWKSARLEGQPGYYQIGLAPGSASGQPAVAVWRAAAGADATALAGIKLAAKPTADGWVVEASMSRDSMDLKELPINATVNVSVVDRDVPGSGGDANWNHLTWNGNDHKDANQFVRMEFR